MKKSVVFYIFVVFCVLGALAFSSMIGSDRARGGITDASKPGEAEFQKGMRSLEGNGEPQDIDKAVRFFRSAAAQGHTESQYMLGACYAEGLGVEQSDTEAVKWYKKAAKQGNAKAQCELGLCYAEGAGVAQSHEKAVKWYRKAAKLGYAKAQCMLGLCYAEGLGVEQSDTEAVKWVKLAADQGLHLAQLALAGCYFTGSGVELNSVEAFKYLMKAAVQPDSDLVDALREMQDAKRQAINKIKEQYPGISDGAAEVILDQQTNPDSKDNYRSLHTDPTTLTPEQIEADEAQRDAIEARFQGRNKRLREKGY